MNDLELLFLVLVVLYVWECACWVRRGSVAFRSWLGRRWQLAEPGLLLGNAKGAFVFNHLLPPLGSMVLAHQFPVSLSPEGVLAFVAPGLGPGWRSPQTGKWFRWEHIRTVEASGRTVRVNTELLLRAPSEGVAAQLVAALRRLKDLPSNQRAGAIERLLKENFDTNALQARWDEFRNAGRNVRVLANTLFLYVFVAAPLVIWLVGFSRTWPALLLGLLACTVSTSLLFRGIHARFYPAAEDDRFTHFLIVMLSPVSTIRAYDLLCRPALEQFHPLALAQVLSPAAQFRAFAQRVLREIRHPALPLCPSQEPTAQAIEEFWRAALAKQTEKFLQRHGMQPEKLLEPPRRADPGCLSYCPRCLALFTTTVGVCEDCGGLALVAFSREENPARGRTEVQALETARPKSMGQKGDSLR